jgi:urease accessory protein
VTASFATEETIAAAGARARWETTRRMPDPARVSRGRLGFERAGARTAVATAYADSPLRILTPRNHGAAAWAYTSTLGGGLVGGDHLTLDLTLGPGAQAFVSTQGPTRVYRSVCGCESEVRARVAAGAALVLTPDPVSCFAGARYRQRTQIDLAASASLATWDVLAAGRVARGERWAFARYLASLSVRREGAPLVEEALLLDPAHGILSERLGRFDGIATLLLAGPLFAGARAAVLARVDAAPLAPGARILAAASPLGSDALLVRFAAESIEELLGTLREQLAGLPALLGDDPWARRN